LEEKYLLKGKGKREKDARCFWGEQKSEVVDAAE
jgi:hypothetical protein